MPNFDLSGYSSAQAMVVSDRAVCEDTYIVVWFLAAKIQRYRRRCERLLRWHTVRHIELNLSLRSTAVWVEYPVVQERQALWFDAIANTFFAPDEIVSEEAEITALRKLRICREGIIVCAHPRTSSWPTFYSGVILWADLGLPPLRRTDHVDRG